MLRISIFGAISAATVEALKFQLDSLDRTQPLTVELNSDGGSVSGGITCHNLLSGWPGGVTIEIVGWALSIASAIAQAGRVRRAHESALIMVHAPWMTSTGNAAALRDNAALLDQVAQTMRTIYRKTGQPDSVINGWLDGTDHWFTAAEALQLGLIDEIIPAQTTSDTPPANASATRHPIPTAFSKRIHAMSTTTYTTTGHDETIRAAAIQAEAARRNGIRASFGKFSDRDGVQALLTRCENDPSVSVEAAGQKLLAHLGQSSSPIAGHYAVRTDFDRMAEFKAAARDSILMRAGIQVAEPHPGVHDLQRSNILGMAESVLSMRGELTRGMNSAQIFATALGTGDFVDLLGNIANKALALAYQEAPAGHAIFSAEREVADFKQNTLVNLSEAPALEEVREHAEYRHGAMSDSASKFQLATFGKIIKISRQALINDDVSAFTRLPQSLGAAARRLEADHVFSLLTGNPTLGDGFALFSAEHGNQGASLPLNATGLGAARAKMRLQKGLAGLSYIDPQPKYLIVPVALETEAEQLLSSLVDPARNNDTANHAFIRGLTLVADPRLDAASTSTWYLSADPRQIEGILRAYLSGQPRPFLEQDTEFKTDAVSFKVRLDFAAGVMDYRGLFCSSGA